MTQKAADIGVKEDKSNMVPVDGSLEITKDMVGKKTMSKAESLGRSLFNQYLLLMLHLAQNDELREQFESGEHGEGAIPFLNNTGMKVPAHDDISVYLDRTAAACSILIRTKDGTVTIAEGPQSVKVSTSEAEEAYVTKDHAKELVTTYNADDIRHQPYEELDFHIDVKNMLGKRPICVVVPYTRITDQALQDYKINDTDDIVLCSC